MVATNHGILRTSSHRSQKEHSKLHRCGKQHDTYTDEDRFGSKVGRGQYCPSLRTVPIAREPRANDKRDHRRAERAVRSRE